MNADDIRAIDTGESDRSSATFGNESVDVEKARRGVRLLLEAIGEDPSRDTLVETWRRRVPTTLATLSAGYRDDARPTMRTFPTENEALVVKTGIPVYSLCEHHLLPYFGTANVAYRPNGEVVGLSKLTRYVRWRSRRLTMQEQLTDDIAAGLAAELGSDVVFVELAATHLCESMRGIETETATRTATTVGDPTDHERQRFRDAVERTEGLL